MTPAAVAEPETELDDLVAQPEHSVLFASRRSNLRLIKRGITPIRDAEGRQVDMKKGEAVVFVGGRFSVPLGEDALVQLEDGEMHDAPEIMAWLDGHRLNGDIMEGFWKVELAAPAPSSTELERLQTLAIELDVEGLKAFIAAERAGWERESLLEVAEGTLTRVEAKWVELNASQDALLAEARAEGEAAAKDASGPPAARVEESKPTAADGAQA